MRFYSLERSSPPLDKGHGTWDIGHRTYDHKYEFIDSFMSFEKLGVVGALGL